METPSVVDEDVDARVSSFRKRIDEFARDDLMKRNAIMNSFIVDIVVHCLIVDIVVGIFRI